MCQSGNADLTVLKFLSHKHFITFFTFRFCSVFLLSHYEITSWRQWHPTPVLLPGKSHGWRSLVDCRPWALEESDTTERLPFHFLLSCIGGGDGNPLQCSCLENPRDGGAWWAAVYGVTQSWTRLKRLSSSSSSSSQRWRSSIQSTKTRPGADCSSDHELLIT